MQGDIKSEVIEALKELKEALKPKAVVFDLDSVLVDSSERYKKCQEEAAGSRKKFWECFLSDKYMDLDRPREDVVKQLRSYLVRGYKIIILTGRVRERQARKTKQQLRKWNIYYHEIVFRDEGDLSKDHVYKVLQLRKLLDRYRIEAVFDDSERVLKTIKKNFPSIQTIKT